MKVILALGFLLLVFGTGYSKDYMRCKEIEDARIDYPFSRWRYLEGFYKCKVKIDNKKLLCILIERPGHKASGDFTIWCTEE